MKRVYSLVPILSLFLGVAPGGASGPASLSLSLSAQESTELVGLIDAQMDLYQKRIGILDHYSQKYYQPMLRYAKKNSDYRQYLENPLLFESNVDDATYKRTSAENEFKKELGLKSIAFSGFAGNAVAMYWSAQSEVFFRARLKAGLEKLNVAKNFLKKENDNRISEGEVRSILTREFQLQALPECLRALQATDLERFKGLKTKAPAAGVLTQVKTAFACGEAMRRLKAKVWIDSPQLSRCLVKTYAAHVRLAQVPHHELILSAQDRERLGRGWEVYEKSLSLMQEEPEKMSRIMKSVLNSFDYSLSPVRMFGFCAKEADGKSLVQALDLCYQFLRVYRMAPDVNRKLMDIRGDRFDGGDNAGDWYHLFGVMAASYITPLSVSPLARLGGNSLNNIRDPIEAYVDGTGAAVARNMVRDLFVARNLPSYGKDAKCSPKEIFTYQK